ncbi:MAG: TonB-dependent siderophore receptor [Vicinamibacterales bacterium]
MMNRHWLLMGAVVASATLGSRLATPAEAATLPSRRYEEAMADLLARRRDLTFPPSWRGAIDAWPEVSRTDAQNRPAIRFDIAPGSLGDVLSAFERITQLKVQVADAAIRTIQSAGVAGVFTPEQALERLLAGTGAGFTFSGPDMVVIDLATVREFVAVTGRAPAVSSPKLTQPLRDIPQTIAVIPKEVIQAQGATSLRDVLRNVPGITFQAGEGGGGLPGDSFTLRGFSATNDMFIDGVRDPGGYSRDAFNLEQVEVAKGPSSSIAGRGTTGGAINQVTKSPTLRPIHEGTIAGGSSDVVRGTIDLNSPVGSADSGIALRLNAMWGQGSVPGRRVVENSGWGIAPSLAFGLGKPTQVTLRSQHLRQDNVPDYGLPWGVYPDYPTGAFEADPPVDQANFYGLRGYDFEDITSDVFSGEVRHRFQNGTTLRNLTRFSQTDRDSAITAPRPPRRQLQRRTMGNEGLANQTSLNTTLGRGFIRHAVVTGVEVARERTANQNSAQATNQPPVTLPNPNPEDRPFGPMPPNTGNPSRTELDQLALFAFDTISAGDRWQLSGGLRWDSVDVDYRLTTVDTGEVTQITRQDGMVSWRAGLAFKPRIEGSVYLAYGTSFNPSVDAAATGAAFSTSPTAANNPNLAPEETRNYETGVKWDAIGGRLSLNGALFRTEKVNARTRTASSEPYVLSGRHRVQGVELGASGSLDNRWTVSAAYAFMNSEIVASENAAEEGGELTLTPEHTLNLWTTFRLPWDFTVGGGAQYMDAVFRNATNTTAVPSYWLFSGLASYEVNRYLTLRLNLQNLFDEQYVDRVGGGHYIPGPRRQVMLSTDVRF